MPPFQGRGGDDLRGRGAASGPGRWLVVLATTASIACSSAETATGPVPPAAPLDGGRAANDATNARVVEGTTTCDVDGLATLTVPARRPRSTLQLRHAYRMFRSGRAGAPVVVVVPGGPGGDIMRSSARDAYPLGAVPSADFDVIYTDARGSGCNAVADADLAPETADAVFRAEEVGMDVAAVVRHAGLDDYILYGASFGTVAATIAAHALERDGGARPRALVLEGTVGRAFESFDAYFDAFRTEWARVEPMLAPVWRAELAKEPWSPTLKWSRDQWGLFVAQQLILGDIPGRGHSLVYWLDGLSKQTVAAQSYVAGFMAKAATPGTPSSLFRTIACRELWGSWRSGREIRGGALNATGEDLCGGAPKVEPYDAARYLLASPVYYFQGPFDPTTTSSQAEHHFDAQVGAPRAFVTVPDAAHAPLTLGLRERGCSSAAWKAIAARLDLTAALATCAGPKRVEVRTQ